MADLLHLLFKKKTAPKMWSILENCFWHISLISISVMFSDGWINKYAKFENIVNYINSYQDIYNKIASLV